MQRHFSIGVHSGNPIDVAGSLITPRAFSLAWRLGPVAYAWNTPVGLDVVHADGRREEVKIVDVTRWALIALGVFAAIFGARTARA